jgi:hypothetical protein
LICDGEAKIAFQKHWFQGGSVILESGTPLYLPWTGSEPLTSGMALKAELPETSDLSAVSDIQNFIVFQAADKALYIEQALFRVQIDDGLAILAKPPEVKVYHCRSR